MKPSPDISWTVERCGVTLVSRSAGAFISIPYPHAGLWALLVGGTFTLERARELMGLLMGEGGGAAEREVSRTLAEWRETGLVVAE